jgi:hypothetical protein
MPYVDRRVRSEFDPYIRRLLEFVKERGVTTGELNYLVTRLMIASLDCVAQGTAKFHYGDLSATHAAVVDAAGEFKRRLLDPYENAICSLNGDLYDALVAKVPPVRPPEKEIP